MTFTNIQCDEIYLWATRNLLKVYAPGSRPAVNAAVYAQLRRSCADNGHSSRRQDREASTRSARTKHEIRLKKIKKTTKYVRQDAKVGNAEAVVDGAPPRPRPRARRPRLVRLGCDTARSTCTRRRTLTRETRFAALYRRSTDESL
ncbi:hypothetical protein EVAR_80020_1 [Eumeta japonica]|uniref:Uncharacterized protein n=1 Tax=Eumeta variegata TaxID=151549 RepID=A0A4C1WP75_EUMVA|nr:hypothetical protein EVAR_80020_1 [Eumeta japonica]